MKAWMLTTPANVAERPLQLVDVPGERLIRSVANNTRLDGREFLG